MHNREHRPKIDAQITSEGELRERLKALDEIGTEEARRLQAVLKIIWEERKKIAKGRKIRRVRDLEANIHEKTEERRADIQKLQGEIAKYVKEFGREDIEKFQGEIVKYVREFYGKEGE